MDSLTDFIERHATAKIDPELKTIARILADNDVPMVEAIIVATSIASVSAEIARVTQQYCAEVLDEHINRVAERYGIDIEL